MKTFCSMLILVCIFLTSSLVQASIPKPGEEFMAATKCFGHISPLFDKVSPNQITAVPLRILFRCNTNKKIIGCVAYTVTPQGLQMIGKSSLKIQNRSTTFLSANSSMRGAGFQALTADRKDQTGGIYNQVLTWIDRRGNASVLVTLSCYGIWRLSKDIKQTPEKNQSKGRDI